MSTMAVRQQGIVQSLQLLLLELLYSTMEAELAAVASHLTGPLALVSSIPNSNIHSKQASSHSTNMNSSRISLAIPPLPSLSTEDSPMRLCSVV